ncbi:MAG: aminopeptidase P N-terminal domain-containing protein [Gemmatimonadota bacterium]
MRIRLFCLIPLCFAAPLTAQQGFTDAFSPAEFAARRSALMTQIGDGVAVMQGTTERRGESPLRQSNQFFYLTGVVEPRAMLIVDGRTHRSTLFLIPKTAAREGQIGPYLGADSAGVATTGIDVILPRDSFAIAVKALGDAGRQIYTPFGPEVLGSESFSDVRRFVAVSKRDPWDGRISREEAFIGHLKEAAPASEIKDLDPLLNTMRATKSPAEIAVIREATRLGGLAIMEVMRDAEPGMYEYELEAAAEYVYKRGGAYGESYFPLIADGRNMPYGWYHKNRAKLVSGDLVQFDWAPDLANYTTDVTRVFPANGRFTPVQREYYTIYLQLYQALMTSIRVHVTGREIMDSAVIKMDRLVAGYRFTDPRIKAAATAFVDRFRRNPDGTGLRAVLGHSVGMEVHDVANPTVTLEPGYIFTIEPQMTTDDGALSVRLEDMILMTPDGYENLSAFIPIEIADIERLMAQPGLGSAELKLPPTGRTAGASVRAPARAKP